MIKQIINVLRKETQSIPFRIGYTLSDRGFFLSSIPVYPTPHSSDFSSSGSITATGGNTLPPSSARSSPHPARRSRHTTPNISIPVVIGWWKEMYRGQCELTLHTKKLCSSFSRELKSFSCWAYVLNTGK
jgi:hypothetical protein